MTDKQLASAPNITAILKEIPYGRMLAFKAMQFSEQPLIQKFLDKYFRVPERDRLSLSIEAIAISAKVDVRHLWGEIMLAMREDSVNKVKAIAVAAHPSVMKKRVQFAKRPEGFRDRDALDTMLGALPPKKEGSTFINKFFASGAKEPDVDDEPVEHVADENFLFPDAEVMQERAQPMRQKLIESRK